MNISKFFIERPIFAIVLSIIIFCLGLIAIPILPSGQYPEVVPPSVVVRTNYPGANPKAIAETVAEPLEEAINGVEGIMYMKSVAGSDGSIQVVVTFRPGVDPDTAAVRVQNRVSQALSRLPDEVRQYGVTTQKQSPTPLMYIGLYSKHGQHDALYLRNYGVLHVKDELSRLTGIGDVQLTGSGDYSMRIWLDPNRLASRSITSSDVVNAIREQNVQVSAGQLGAEPSPNKPDFLTSINVRGRLTTPQEFSNIVLKSGANGQVVHLSDVARVELGASDYTLHTYIDTQDTAIVGIFLTPGANALGVAKEVHAKLEELSKAFPDDVAYKAVWDPTEFIRDSIDAVQHTLIEAVVLVVIVVIVFLQTWRASIIPLIAVPVSIVGTFAWLYVLGYSINTLTLFGMVLAIGIVVDDAIVVVENVERFIEHGLAPKEAANAAMKEVSGPIVAIALVLCAVFVPMAFLTGITGQFYKQFAVTIAISTVISAINSLTLSPALAAKLLHAPGARKDWLARAIDSALGWFFRPFNRLFKRSSEAYQGAVAQSFRFRGGVFLVYFVLIGSIYVLFNHVPGGFIPTQDELYLFGGAKLPEGASLARTDDVVREMVRTAHEVEGVTRSTVAQQVSKALAIGRDSYGITQALIIAFAYDAMQVPGELSLDTAFAAFDEALAVIDARSPRVAPSDDPEDPYEPPPQGTPQDRADIERAFALAILGQLYHPGRERKRRTLLAIVSVIQQRPDVASEACSVALSTISDAATLSWLLCLLGWDIEGSQTVVAACQRQLRDLASRDTLTVRALARRLIREDFPPLPDSGQPDPALLRASNRSRLANPRIPGSQGYLRATAGIRLRDAEELLPGITNAVREQMDPLFDDARVRRRLEAQLDAYADRSRKKWPNAFTVHDEMVEQSLQSVGASGRAALRAAGDAPDDPIVYEDELASLLLNDPSLPLLLEETRVPRPSLSVPPGEADPIWARVKLRSAGTSAESTGIEEAVESEDQLDATVAIEAAETAAWLVDSGEFRGWYWLGTMERRRIEQAEWRVTEDLVSNRFKVVEIRDANDRSAFDLPPLTIGDLDLWFTWSLLAGTDITFQHSQPLIGLDNALNAVGDARSGLGAPPGILSPTEKLIGALGLEPGERLAFEDDLGTGLALVTWRTEYDRSEHYLDSPRLNGCGIVLRPDLFHRLMQLAGPGRVVIRDFISGSHELARTNPSTSDMSLVDN